MTSKSDKVDMLEEVLGESLPDGFREEILQHTLRSVRNRRRYRRACKMAGALAAVLVAGIIFYAIWPKQLSRESAVPGYEVIRTSRFPSSSIVNTKPLPGDQLATAMVAVSVVHTQKSGFYRDITDDELLALATGRSGLLVRVGPGKQELIFANEADQRGFPLN